MQYMRNIILGHLVTVTASPICPRFDGFDRDIDFSVHRAGTEEKVGYHLCVLYHKILSYDITLWLAWRTNA